MFYQNYLNRMAKLIDLKNKNKNWNPDAFFKKYEEAKKNGKKTFKYENETYRVEDLEETINYSDYLEPKTERI